MNTGKLKVHLNFLKNGGYIVPPAPQPPEVLLVFITILLHFTQFYNPDFIFEIPPRLQKSLTDVRVEDGEEAVLSCVVTGRPKPTVMWTGPDHTAVVTGERIMEDHSNEGLVKLTVRSFSPL